jgi:two-component system, cell cycle sensor histidine kinase and response regulator CckA
MREGKSRTDELVRDNAALRRQVAGLEAEARRLEATLHGIGDAVICTDASGNVRNMNHVSEALTGWSELDALGRPVAEVFKIADEKTRSEVEGPVPRVLREGVVVGFANHTLLIAKDGGERAIADSGVPVRDEKGEISGAVLVFRDQTAERAAQRALQASEAFNGTLIESIPQKLSLKDRNSVYLRVNEIFATSLGCNSAALVGKDDFAFYPSALAEKHRADDQAVMESGRVRVIEESFVAQDKERWVRTTKSPVRNDAGAVTAVLGLSEDITERKRAEYKVKGSEKRYRRLFEAAKDGILILDAGSGKIEDVNPYLMELTGYSYEDFIGRHLWEIGPFKDIAASKDSFAQLQTEKYVRYEDLPLKARDGRRVDVEFVSNVYRVDDQDVIQCNIRDVTARKLAEAEHVRLTTAIEQAAEMVLVTDAQGNIVYANPAFEAVTGHVRADLIGQNPRLLRSGVQDEAFYRALWATISGGQTWHGRMVNKKKDGTHYTEDLSISPVRDGAGVITSYVAVKRDITRELGLDAQLRQTQKMEGIGRLAGGVAHDFNNLLSVILSYVGLVLEELRLGDPIRDDLLEVKKAGERAAALTQQLLAFSRKQVLRPTLLNLNEVAAGVERMLRRILGADIDFVQVLAPDLGLTLADQGQIEQVLMNLVVNARDAMPHEGKLTIETSNVELDEEYASRHAGVAPGHYVMLAVSDTGCGMDEQTRARIFDPFYTTKDSDKGTGLGLSTVYGIVQQSGGSIWVYSEIGAGTTLKVYLPRQREATTTPAVEPSGFPGRSTGTETILVVEDEEALRAVARRCLEGAGYTMLAAANGDEALATYARHAGEIHLLLTDVVMPRMSGRALAQELSATQPSLRVLYMSGYANDAIVHRGVLDAGTHFLSKPFTAADLTRKVREVLDGGGGNLADEVRRT